MSESDPINPYVPPSAAPAPEVTPQGPSVLKDPRMMGWFAIAGIIVQVVINLVLMSIEKRPDVLPLLVVGQGLSLLFAAVCFFVWLGRCMSNMQRLYPRMRMNPVWGIGCYFIPIVNLVCPFIEMRRLVIATFLPSVASGMQVATVIWWITFLMRLFVTKFGISSEVIVVWIASSIFSAACISVLILRISSRQAKFRWTETPASGRTMMHALPPRRAQAPQVKRVIPGSEAEDGWGKS